LPKSVGRKQILFWSKFSSELHRHRIFCKAVHSTWIQRNIELHRHNIMQKYTFLWIFIKLLLSFRGLYVQIPISSGLTVKFHRKWLRGPWRGIEHLYGTVWLHILVLRGVWAANLLESRSCGKFNLVKVGRSVAPLHGPHSLRGLDPGGRDATFKFPATRSHNICN
jgi:hypothetical protein